MSSPFLKDPGDLLDYRIDYTDFLAGDTITGTPAWQVPSGLTNSAATSNTTTATIWLSGGTHGRDYIVTNTITTAGGRTKQQSFVVQVRNDVA